LTLKEFRVSPFVLPLRELQPARVTSPGRLSRADPPLLPAPRQATWTDQPLILLDGGKPYLVAPVERDPHRTARGRHPMPAAARAVLRRYAAAGHRFDRVAIVHELDPAGPVGTLAGMLRHGPVTCSDAVARAVVGPVPDHPATARAVRSIDAVVGGGVRAIGSALRQRPALDPIVFGVVGIGDGVPVDGEPAVWYPLCGWVW
jgi:hypothetical protein